MLATSERSVPHLSAETCLFFDVAKRRVNALLASRGVPGCGGTKSYRTLRRKVVSVTWPGAHPQNCCEANLGLRPRNAESE